MEKQCIRLTRPILTHTKIIRFDPLPKPPGPPVFPPIHICTDELNHIISLCVCYVLPKMLIFELQSPWPLPKIYPTPQKEFYLACR